MSKKINFAISINQNNKDESSGLTMFSKILIIMIMKVVSSIKTLKNRHPDCKVVRRRGRLYVINKTNPRFKARQG